MVRVVTADLRRRWWWRRQWLRLKCYSYAYFFDGSNVRDFERQYRSHLRRTDPDALRTTAVYFVIERCTFSGTPIMVTSSFGVHGGGALSEFPNSADFLQVTFVKRVNYSGFEHAHVEVRDSHSGGGGRGQAPKHLYWNNLFFEFRPPWLAELECRNRLPSLSAVCRNSLQTTWEVAHVATLVM